MEKKRSVGIAILGWYIIINGLTSFVVLIIAAFKPIDFSFFMIEEGVISTWGVLYGVGTIILGWNILKLKEWARWVLMIALSILICLATVAIFVKKGVLGNVFIGAICLLVIYYLTRPKVKEQFR